MDILEELDSLSLHNFMCMLVDLIVLRRDTWFYWSYCINMPDVTLYLFSWKRNFYIIRWNLEFAVAHDLSSCVFSYSVHNLPGLGQFLLYHVQQKFDDLKNSVKFELYQYNCGSHADSDTKFRCSCSCEFKKKSFMLFRSNYVCVDQAIKCYNINKN